MLDLLEAVELDEQLIQRHFGVLLVLHGISHHITRQHDTLVVRRAPTASISSMKIMHGAFLRAAAARRQFWMNVA